MRTFLLALLGSIPAVAHATCTVDPMGGGDYATLQGAISGCAAADMPIELLSDVTEDVTIARAVTIDGGGFTLTGTGGDSVVTITSGTSAIRDLDITGGNAVYGGGMRAQSGTFVILNDVRLFDNIADVGGGIATQGTLLVFDSEVLDNVATTNGGGIAAVGTGGQNVLVSASTVDGNSAGDDGGGIYAEDVDLSLEGVIVRANTAGGSGGGVRAVAVSSASMTVEVWATFLSTNTAGFKGGGLSVVDSELIMTQSESFANTAVLDGGGVYIDSSADVLMSDSTISQNTAGTGGGMRLGGAGVHTLRMLTVVDNQAASSEQLLSTSSNLQAAGLAFGESGANNGIADCSVASGQVRYTVSVDGTCRTAHASNQTAPLGLLPIFVGMYQPTQLSVLKDLVPAGFCTARDQLNATRSPLPCDGGAVEH